MIVRRLNAMNPNAWSAEEDALLSRQLDPKLSAGELREIAARINRSFDAVDTRYRTLRRAAGVTIKAKRAERKIGTGPANGKRAFTREEDTEILRLRDEEYMPFPAIARTLNRDTNTIVRRYEALDAGTVTPTPVVVKRSCLKCDVRFSYDRADGVPLFMCSSCRSRSGSPYEPGGMGTSGRRVSTSRHA